MSKHFFVAFCSALLLASCNNTPEGKKEDVVKTDSVATSPKLECKDYLQKAKDADQVLLSATAMNKADAETAIRAFNDYIMFCTSDSLVPLFLLKTGQVAQSIGNFKLAETMLTKCAGSFPDYVNRPAALFLLAQLYDDPKQLNNESEAKDIYEEIIKKYPKTPIANDAKMCLANLGKSDEQLIQEFLKNNK